MLKFLISERLTKPIQNKTCELSAMVGGEGWQGRRQERTSIDFQSGNKKRVMRHDCLAPTYNKYEALATKANHWHVNKRINAQRKKKEEERAAFPMLKQIDAFPRKRHKAIISLFSSADFMVFYSKVAIIFRAHDDHKLINHNSLEERRISLPFGTDRCYRSPVLLQFSRSAVGNSHS